MMKTQRVYYLGLVLLLASLGVANSQQDALDVLNKVGANYRSMKTLRAEGDVTMATNGPDMQQNMTMHLLLTVAPPGKVRMESKLGMVGFLMISDGQSTWIYLPQLNKYSKLPLNQAASGGNTSMAGGIPGLGAVPDFGTIAEDVKDARIVRSESLQLDGIAADCYVIEVVHEPSQSTTGAKASASEVPTKVDPVSEILWVDKGRLLVVRMSSDAKVTLPGASAATDTKSTITFNKLTLDDAVPDDAFVFTPPQGATEMDLGQFMPQGATRAPAAPPAP
jgi:outer membrane lipoprotein-sorting protein